MTAANSAYNLLMLSGDSSVARGQDGAFYQMLAHFSRHWARIDILTPAATDATQCAIHGNVHVHPAPYHRLLQPVFIRQQAERLLRERRYHLLISHDFGFFYNGFGAYWLTRKHDMPLVSEIHHIEGDPMAVNWRERLWRAAATRYIPFIAPHVAAFRVVNQGVGARLQALGAPPEKILHLPSLYLDFDRFQPHAAEKRYDLLFVGRLASNKGIDLLLDAFLQLRQTHPDVTLAIRGEGVLRPMIDDLITTHQLQKNIIWLPRAADPDALATLYQQAKMLICASTVEGNPRVTAEAMACGTPVISTRVGIMPELITSGENGLLVDHDAGALATAIRQLLDDPALRDQFSQRGRAAVLPYQAETIIAQYAHAYHRLIAAHAGR